VRIAFGWIILGALLAGCATGSPSNLPSAGSSAPETGASTCQAIDLVTPGGEPIDLSGTWYGNDETYYSLLQSGDCLWATGSNDRYVLVMRGTVQRDFTVDVDFGVVAYEIGAPQAHRSGTDTYQIEVTTNGGIESLVLRGLDTGRPGAPVRVLSRISATPVFPAPTPGS
jgi:hypothetical protein